MCCVATNDILNSFEHDPLVFGRHRVGGEFSEGWPKEAFNQQGDNKNREDGRRIAHVWCSLRIVEESKAARIDRKVLKLFKI